MFRRCGAVLTWTHRDPHGPELFSPASKRAYKRTHRYGVNMILEKFPEVGRLTASEKLIFASELWNDLEAHPQEVPVSRRVITELDRRRDRFREHPEDFTTWEAVKERVLGPGR